jgi:hypothetical protein
VGAQFARPGIDNGKFLLDTEGENMIFGAHQADQCCAKNCTLSPRMNVAAVADRGPASPIPATLFTQKCARLPCENR